jgi:uncharacterized protein (DUF362 family)
VLASSNVFALDVVLAQLFDIEWQQIPLLRMAAEESIFCPDETELDIRGDSPAIRERFSKAKLPEELAPISFSLPRLIKGFIRHIKQKMSKSQE